METSYLLNSFTEFFTENWAALGWDARIFYCIGGIALAAVLVQAVLLLFGVGNDLPDDFSPEFDSPHDIGFGLISVRTLTAFFMGFGLTGGPLLAAGTAFPTALAAAVAVGCIFMLIIFGIMKALYGLRASGNLNIASAAGTTGTVYVAIEPNRAAGGQVEVCVSGRMITLPALTAGTEKIPAGTLVRVANVISPNILLVEKI